jgi:hypothetical protein
MSTKDVGFFEIAKWAHLAWFVFASMVLLWWMVQFLEGRKFVHPSRRDPVSLHVKAILGLYFLPEVLLYLAFLRSFDDPWGTLKFWERGKKQAPILYG